MTTRWIIVTVCVAGQRILPGLQRRMADRRVDEVHLADAALILLERRDLLRVGRPEEDRAVAARPAGVVGRVAEVLDAVLGQLRLPAGRDVADPEIPVADERRALAVGRHLRVRGRRAAPPRARLFALGRLARRQVARGLASPWPGRPARLRRPSRCVTRYQKRSADRPAATSARTPVVQHERRRVVGHEFFGARVVGRGQRGRRVGCALRQGGGRGQSARRAAQGPDGR